MDYLFNNILEHIRYPKLLHFLVVSRRTNEISKNKLINRNIHLKRDITTFELKNVMRYFNFKRVDLSHTYIKDDAIEFLQNCRNVNLNWCKFITDDSLKYLSKCHTINLNLCKISKLESLKTCKNVSLFSCQNITYNEIVNLQDCHQVDISQTSMAYNFQLYHNLSKLHNIDLSGVDVSEFQNCREYLFINILKLNNCFKIIIDTSFQKYFQQINEMKIKNIDFWKL